MKITEKTFHNNGCPECKSKNLLLGEYAYYRQKQVCCEDCGAMYVNGLFGLYKRVESVDDLDWGVNKE